MATKNDLGALLEQAQKRWATYDEEEKKKRVDDEKKIEKGLSSGKSWEDISKDSKIEVDRVKEFSERTRPGYGVKPQPSNFQKFTDKLQGLGYKLSGSDGQGAADASLEASQEKVLRLMQDPSIPVERKQALLQYTAVNSAENPLVAAQNTTDITKATSPAEIGKNMVTGVVSLPADVIERGTRPFRSDTTVSLNSDQLVQAQELAKKLPDDIKEGARNLNPSQQAEILKFVSQGFSETQLRNYVKQAQEEKSQTDRQMAGAALEASSLAFGGGNLTQAYKQGGKQLLKTTLGTGLSGVSGGTGYELRNNPEASSGELVKAGLFGGGAGIGLSVTTAGLGAAYRQRLGVIKDPSRLLPETASIPAERQLPAVGSQGAKVFDESRQIPYKASDGAKVITDRSRLLEAGDADPNLAVVSKGADPKDVKRLQAVEQKIRTAQRTGNITPESGRALMREREELVTRIQNPETQISKELGKVDEAIDAAQTSGDTRRVVRLGNERQFIEDEAVKDAVNVEVESMLAVPRPPSLEADIAGVGAGGEKASRLSARTEELAIKDKLVKEFGDTPTYQTTNWGDEASAVVDHMNRDMDGAVRIAMGIDPPPAGVTANSYYVGVISRARKTSDAELARKLAVEGTRSQASSRMGQEIAALSQLDPENPVTAMKSILQARKEANGRIPAVITKEESEQVTNLSKTLLEAKETALNGGDKKAYGKARIAFDNYVDELRSSVKPNLGDSLKTAKFYKRAALKSAGLTKSLVATLDNSVIGRQGWKTLMTHPKVWAKNSLKSFEDIARTYKGREVLDEVHADVVARDNALNGLYQKMGLDVYGAKKNFLEEAFPVSFGKVKKTKAGRVVTTPFKASEVAFSAWQQRTRADLADQYLNIAKNMGVDITDKRELKSIGKMVNSLTSRGHLGKTGERAAEALNNTFFSPRLFKSNIDVLGGHVLTGAGGSNFVRKRAARNLVKMAVGSALALKLASAATGGRAEADPRSSNFGKVKIGDTRFDLTGGMAGLVTLGARILPALPFVPGDPQSKSSATGELKRLNSGDFGSQTTFDVLQQFTENKLSPAARVIVDQMNGKDFDGNKPTLASVTKSLTVPLTIQHYGELKDNPRSANIVAAMIAEGLGVSANTYGLESNWNSNNSKQIESFKGTVSKDKFEQANKTFNDRFIDWYDQVSADDRYWKLPQEKRESMVTSKKNSLTQEVLEENGYKKPRVKKDRSTEKLISELKKY